MAILKNIPVCKCDECDHLWLPDGVGVPKRCPSRKCRKTSWNHLAEERPEKPPGKKRTVSAIERKMVRGPKNRLRSWSEPAIPKIDFRKRAAGDDDEMDEVQAGIADGHIALGSDCVGGNSDHDFRHLVCVEVDDGQLPDGPRTGDDDNGYLGQGTRDDACPERSSGECSVDRLRVSLRGDVPAEAETVETIVKQEIGLRTEATIVNGVITAVSITTGGTKPPWDAAAEKHFVLPRLNDMPNVPRDGLDFNLIAGQVHGCPSEVDITRELPIEEALVRYPDREDEIRAKVAEVVQEASDGREVEDSTVGSMLVRDAGDSLRGVEPDLHDGSGDGYSVDGDTSIETRVVVVDEYSEGYIPLSTRVPVVAQLWAPPADDSEPEEHREGETLAERFRRATAALAEAEKKS